MINLEYLTTLFEKYDFKTKKELADFLSISNQELNRELYNCGLPQKISKIKYIVQLKKYNIPLDKTWLEENYLKSNKSLSELEHDLGVPNRFLERLCVWHHISKRYKYSFNKNKFYNIYDPNVWYLAGLIATDGCLDRFANRISVGLVGESEKDLLTDISNYFEDTRGVFVINRLDKFGNKSYKVYNISFSDKYIKEFFNKSFNIFYSDNKSKTFALGFPDYFPNDLCKKAFVLGCFDGDGCITHLNSNNPSAGLLTASKNFVYGLSNLLERELGINTHFIESKYFSISISVNDGLEKFLDWMYSYNGFRLDRKYKRYLKVKDIVCSTVNTK